MKLPGGGNGMAVGQLEPQLLEPKWLRIVVVVVVVVVAAAVVVVVVVAVVVAVVAIGTSGSCGNPS